MAQDNAIEQSARALVASSTFVRTVVGLAGIFSLSLLPIIWNSNTGVQSQVWTGTAVASMLFAVLVSKSYLAGDRRIRLLMIGLFLAYPIFCVLSYHFSHGVNAAKEAYLIEDFKRPFLAAVYFYFGIAVARSMPTKALLVTVAISAAYVLFGDGSPTKGEMSLRMQESGTRFFYQHLGDFFVIGLLILCIRLRSNLALLAVALLGIACALLIPSRSSGVIGSLALVVLLATRMPLRYVLLGAPVIAAVLFFFGTDMATTMFEGTRFEDLLGPEQDSSARERERILDRGWEAILESPFIGSYSFQVDEFGESGYYIHNFLDVWAQAGIVPFLFLAGAIFFLVLNVARLIRVNRVHGLALLPILFFLLASWFFTRVAFTTGMFVCCGVIAAHRVPCSVVVVPRKARKAMRAWRKSVGSQP